MKKKFITFLLATFFATSLVGCGNSSNNNSSVTNVTVDTIDNEYISVDYPSDKWQVEDIDDYNEYIPLILSYNSETNYDSSISVTTLETTDDLEYILEGLKSDLINSEADILESEIKNIGNREAIYMEYTMPSFLDEDITFVSMGILSNGKIAMIQSFIRESERKDILEAMNIMVETIEVK